MLNAPPPAPLPPAPLHYLVFDYLKGEPRLRRHTPPFVTQDGLGWIDAPGVPATLRLVALPPSSTTGGPTAGVMRIRGRGVSGDASCCGGVTAGKDGGLCARIGSFAVVMASGLVVVLMLRGMNVPLIGASDVVKDNLRTLIRASDDIATHRLLGRSATHTEEAPSTIANGPPELPDIIIQQGKPRTGTTGTFVRRAYNTCVRALFSLAHSRTHARTCSSIPDIVRNRKHVAQGRGERWLRFYDRSPSERAERLPEQDLRDKAAPVCVEDAHECALACQRL